MPNQCVKPLCCRMQRIRDQMSLACSICSRCRRYLSTTSLPVMRISNKNLHPAEQVTRTSLLSCIQSFTLGTLCQKHFLGCLTSKPRHAREPIKNYPISEPIRNGKRIFSLRPIPPGRCHFYHTLHTTSGGPYLSAGKVEDVVLCAIPCWLSWYGSLSKMVAEDRKLDLF